MHQANKLLQEFSKTTALTQLKSKIPHLTDSLWKSLQTIKSKFLHHILCIDWLNRRSLLRETPRDSERLWQTPRDSKRFQETPRDWETRNSHSTDSERLERDEGCNFGVKTIQHVHPDIGDLIDEQPGDLQTSLSCQTPNLLPPESIYTLLTVGEERQHR